MQQGKSSATGKRRKVPEAATDNPPHTYIHKYMTDSKQNLTYAFGNAYLELCVCAAGLGSESIPEGFRKESRKSRKTCKNTMFRKFPGRFTEEIPEESGNECPAEGFFTIRVRLKDSLPFVSD